MKRYQLLVVDDSSIAREAVKAILANFHCDVVIAESGEQAIEQCNLMQFDLIMMDLSLPRHNGFEFIEFIRENSILNKKTPMVALTIHNEGYFTAQIQKAHLNGFITKPLTRVKVTELINQLDQETLSSSKKELK
ncbi:MAG: response regulator [Proteobacteria bacterium]|nr:response regulator [Bacteroidota bacterium]MDA1256213.1 response regulator [Pseudomonadota bacterium]